MLVSCCLVKLKLICSITHRALRRSSERQLETIPEHQARQSTGCFVRGDPQYVGQLTDGQSDEAGKEARANMGLFPEIQRAWFTVDNKLFLWDYNDG